MWAFKQVDEIAKAVKKPTHYTSQPTLTAKAKDFLAHQEVLKSKKICLKAKRSNVALQRDHQNAIQDAFKDPRELDIELVDAYMARRALDYLVGFRCRRYCGEKVTGVALSGTCSPWRCG